MRGIIDHRDLQSLAPDEAAALLYARTSDPAADADWLLLEEWLNESESNAEAWARIEAVMSALDDSDEDETLRILRLDAKEAGRGVARWRGSFAVAASVVLLLLVGALALGSGLIPGGDKSGTLVAQSGRDTPTTMRTKEHEVRAFALSDGSRMTLDADSAVQIAFSPDHRDLTLLKGRANFDVSRDPDRPFAVRAADHDIVAVGTRFDVGLEPGGLHVVLTEGRLKVVNREAGGATIMLAAGQELTVEPGSTPRVSDVDPETGSEWVDGFLTVRNLPLGEVIELMNRYSSDRLVIRDPRVAALRVTGTLKAGDLPRFAATIKAIHPVRVVRTGQEWEIRWAGRR